MSGTLTPAYNRDYKSKKEVLADWNANKDFVLNTHEVQTYINREQAEKAGMTQFQIRWKKQTMVAIIKKTEKGWV